VHLWSATTRVTKLSASGALRAATPAFLPLSVLNAALAFTSITKPASQAVLFAISVKKICSTASRALTTVFIVLAITNVLIAVSQLILEYFPRKQTDAFRLMAISMIQLPSASLAQSAAQHVFLNTFVRHVSADTT